MKQQRFSGFTLIELLLVMGLFAVVIGLSTPVAIGFLTRNDLSQTTVQAKSMLRRSAQLAMQGEQDSAWGVRFASGAVTLFAGNSYATRNTAFDEVLTVPSTITASGVTETVFQKLSGLPAPIGVITLTSPAGTRSITINSEGMATE